MSPTDLLFGTLALPVSLPLAMSVLCLALAITILLVVRRGAGRLHPANRVGAAVASVSTRMPQRALGQQIRDVAFRKAPDWHFLVLLERRRTDRQHTVAEIFASVCQPSQLAGVALSSRPDWAYYNTDAGDLTAPYRPARRSAVH